MTNVDRRRDFSDVNYKEVHGTIFPADVRTTDAVSASIKTRGEKKPFEKVRVWKLSPLGVEILLPDFVDLEKGTSVDLQLQISRQSTNFEGLVVDVVATNESGRIAGIRLSRVKPQRFERENRRRFTRWQCSSQFYPVAISPNPVEFNDFIYFRLKDVSSNGFRAITSLRNKFLVPGMKLTMQISFPMIGYTSIDATISRANLTAEEGKDYLELGFNVTRLSNKDREIMGQYLIQFGDATSLKSIRDEGFYPKSLVAALDYCFVKTEEDFQDSLKLRHAANLAAEKIPGDYEAAEMSDLYDARSRIINWKFKGECVGTVRATFCENDELLEVEEFITLPPNLPRRDLIAEIGRAATHPEYRKGDLFGNIMQRSALLCLQANKTFLVISTTEELVSTYERVGLTNTGLTYIHPLYPTKTQIVLYADIKDMLAGKNVGLIAWNLVWKEVMEHAIENGSFDAKELRTTKTYVYKALAPLTLIPKLFMNQPRRSKLPRRDE